jgi:acyl-CoA synthetase (AMP-forming)/AMP-acid ligase II
MASMEDRDNRSGAAHERSLSGHADLLTIDDFITYWAAERPGTTVLEQDGRKTTFAELEELSRRTAAALSKVGVARGDRIAWLGKNSDFYFQLLFSAARAGIVMVPIGWRLAIPEIEFILSDTRVKLLVVGESFAGVAHEAAARLDDPPTVVTSGEARTLFASAPADPVVAAAPDDPVLQLYTSGTTGKPKGALVSARNLFGLRAPALGAGLPWQMYDEDEALLVCMPCAHIGGTGLAMMCLANGIRGIIQAEFAPETCLEGIQQGATRLFIVPAALQMVIHHPRASDTDFSRLKYVMYGAAPIPLELLRKSMETMTGAKFLQCYGSTETSGTIVMLPPEDHSIAGTPRMRSAGKALPGVELKIVDGGGQELPRGHIGEIVTRSSSNMLGYWQLPEATCATVTDDGWLHTGDAACMDEDGYIYLQDRLKDMIITGGENVYPAEVENAIYGHPDVAEVAVIGVPDSRWGEAVKACVVPKSGHEVDAGSVIAWARERIAPFKVPKSVDVIPELPRNTSGKILRRELREPYWSNHARRVN